MWNWILHLSDTLRAGGDMETMNEVESPAQCAAMCNVNTHCMAWSYEKGDCTLKKTMPLHAYNRGTTSGKWNNPDPGRGGSLLTLPLNASDWSSLLKPQDQNPLNFSKSSNFLISYNNIVYWACGNMAKTEYIKIIINLLFTIIGLNIICKIWSDLFHHRSEGVLGDPRKQVDLYTAGKVPK